MPRTYDASRRAQAAQRTREDIVAAAFKLHGLGILDYESLAAEANVSIPTIRKHFPTRDILFQHCTVWGMHRAALPDLDRVRAVEDAGARTSLAVGQLCAAYESLFGQLWMAYLHQRESPSLAAAVQDLEALRDGLVEAVIESWQPDNRSADTARGVAVGLLSFLTYRALRHDGGLSPELAVEQIANALQCRLEALCRESGRGGASS